MNNIKKSVKTILNRIEYSGDYCGGGKLDVAPPNIIINNIEPLVFPLDETQAKRIIDQCQLAPFGFRDQTLYDIRVSFNKKLFLLEYCHANFRSDIHGNLNQMLCKWTIHYGLVKQ